MRNKTISKWVLRALLLTITGVFLAGCATTEKPEPALMPTDRGTVILRDKYEFKRPPKGWALMQNVSGGDYEFGFLNLKLEKGEFPSQTTMFYNEEPFGSSRDLETRAKQYSTYFLAGRGISMKITKMEKSEAAGRPALVVQMEGKNPYRNEKATSTVYFFKTGESEEAKKKEIKIKAE